MPKGYFIARVNVSDAEQYAAYAKAATEAIKAHGGTVLVRGGAAECMEGELKERNVVIEFPSLDQARAYYQSSEYQAAKALREGAAVADMIIVEGV